MQQHKKYQLLYSHNKTSFGYNFRNKESCPLSGECLTSQLVHRTSIINAVNEKMKKYISPADTTFKERQ